jgi:hypothetical protein
LIVSLLPLFVLVSLAGPMEEAGVPALSFEFTGCPAGEAQEMEELVRADVSWAPGDPSMSLTLRCEPTGIAIALKVDEAGAGERFVNLATTPADARARTAALIATELILVGRMAAPAVMPPRGQTRSATSPDDAVASPAPAENVGSRSPAVQSNAPPSTSPGGHGHAVAVLAVVGAALHQIDPNTPLFEGGVRGRWAATRTFGLAIDGGGLLQRRTDPRGTLLALGGALSFLVEAGKGFPGGAFRAGLGARAMVLRLSGSAASADLLGASAWGAAVGPVARIAVSREGRRLVAEVALAGGWAGPDLVGTIAGQSPFGVGGWWAGASLAAGWVVGVN